MITEPTVFIIGAGASVPYGFPTGVQLKTAIIDEFVGKFNSMVDSRTITMETFFDEDEAKDEARNFIAAFKEAISPSIDFFLSANPDLGQIGRMAIVLSIMESELNYFLMESRGEKVNDWFDKLFTEMARNLTFAEGYREFANKEHNNVTFITFNYDRLLEHLIFYGLKSFYRDALINDLIRIYREIDLIHIYGKVGPLTEPDRAEGSHSIFTLDEGHPALKWGSKPRFAHLDKAYKFIEIMYEKRQANINEEAKRAIDAASRIIFLGFGYDNDNLKVLGFPLQSLNGKKVYGTAFDCSPAQINQYKINICANSSPDDILLEPIDCKALLEQVFV